MRDDEPQENSIEAWMRAIADEVSRSMGRLSDIDVDDLARTAGIDPEQARRWAEGAGRWLRGQVEFPTEGAAPPEPTERPEAAPHDPLRGAGPHPLDVPTEEQGLALAALDSGRWTLEPGTSALTGNGEGPGPRDALGLVRELRVRDWVDAEGRLTVTGRHALRRWLDATD
jgi:hypothetical protein